MKMDAEILVPILLRIRQALERWMAHRSRCLTHLEHDTPSSVERQLRRALIDALVGDPVSEFRVHADNLACLVADSIGDDGVFARAGVRAAVDMFFGRSLFRPGADSGVLGGDWQWQPRRGLGAEDRAAIRSAEVAGRDFMNLVRTLPHESAKKRLDECERLYDAAWRRVHAALVDTAA